MISTTIIEQKKNKKIQIIRTYSITAIKTVKNKVTKQKKKPRVLVKTRPKPKRLVSKITQPEWVRNLNFFIRFRKKKRFKNKRRKDQRKSFKYLKLFKYIINNLKKTKITKVRGGKGVVHFISKFNLACKNYFCNLYSIKQKLYRKIKTISNKNNNIQSPPFLRYISHIEHRVDVFLYRLHFSSKFHKIRRWILEGHIAINHNVIKKPNYIIKCLDVVTFTNFLFKFFKERFFWLFFKQMRRYHPFKSKKKKYLYKRSKKYATVYRPNYAEVSYFSFTIVLHRYLRFNDFFFSTRLILNPLKKKKFNYFPKIRMISTKIMYRFVTIL
jgi:ribosomal protein S4